MRQQIEEFLADLISMGFTKEKACEKAYEYAIALQVDGNFEAAQQMGGQIAGALITSTMMALAATLVSQALPGAYRIHELRNRMW